jgi:TPP-dependent pyruvate/acetoin dehydrogenase alpha subunit
VLHETMNLAMLWKLPVLFVCENNGYAVTLSQARSTAGSLVERAAAYGMAAESVDGMDVEAVLSAAAAAAERARRGGGPTFLECRTYRFFGHHTAERTMKLGYRTDEEIGSWRERDPLLVAGPKVADDLRVRIDAEVDRLLDDAVEYARRSPRPDPSEALDLVYASGLQPRDGVAA